MERVLRTSSLLFAIGAFALLLFGVFSSRVNREVLVLDSYSKLFGEIEGKDSRMFEFNAINRSSTAVKVVGATLGNSGCLKVENLRLEIPPRDRRASRVIFDGLDWNVGTVRGNEPRYVPRSPRAVSAFEAWWSRARTKANSGRSDRYSSFWCRS